jgi:hypothetical protein
MTQIVLEKSEIEGIVVREVRRRDCCGGFASIRVVPVQGNDAINWAVDKPNYGDAIRDDCDHALRAIVPGMQRRYRLRIR